VNEMEELRLELVANMKTSSLEADFEKGVHNRWRQHPLTSKEVAQTPP
jgi:hypothetical protein